MCPSRGVTRRCRLSWLTNSALVCEPKCWGRGDGCGVSANEYIQLYTGAQINFGDRTSYLTYGPSCEKIKKQRRPAMSSSLTHLSSHKKVFSPHVPLHGVICFVHVLLHIWEMEMERKKSGLVDLSFFAIHSDREISHVYYL